MKRIAASLVVLISVAGTGAVWAHGGATGIVKERMDAMTEIGRNVKIVAQMLKGETPYDLQAVAGAGREISAHAGNAMTRLFPEGSLERPTEATAEIWADWAAFSRLAEQLKTSAVSLEQAAERGAAREAVAAAFGQVAGTCKTCHESFRIKK